MNLMYNLARDLDPMYVDFQGPFIAVFDPSF